MNHHLLVTVIGFGVTYPMDSDLSARTHFFYPYFEQLGTVLEHTTLIKQVKKTRDWVLIVSPFLTSDLEQYEQEGGAGMFFLFFFGRFFFGSSYSSFLAKSAPFKIYRKHI